MPSELLRTLVAWLIILPSAFLAGTLYERLVPQRDSLIRGILYYALGLATLSYGVVILSAVHLLASSYIWVMLFLPILVRANKLGEWLQWLKELGKSLMPKADLSSRVHFGLFVISFICLLMGTLTPEIGGDALCYQLNLPKVFLRQGSLTPDPLDYNSFFPLLVNNLFLIGLATGGVFAAKLFHFLCGFLLFLSIKRLLQTETKNYPLSLFVALVVFTTPTVYNLLSTTYIDVALAFYTFLAVISFFEALDSGRKIDFFLGGLLLGCGISIKYLCLISAIGLFCVWLYSAVTTRRFLSHLRGGVFFALGMIVVAGYWLIRNWLLTGNPFFPYWGSFLGAENRPVPALSIYGYGTSLFHYLALYFNMFLAPDAFGTFAGRIGIFYFLFIPFILLGMLFVPRSRGYGIFWLVFTTIMFFIAQADRWILPVLPVMAIVGASGIEWTRLRLTSVTGLWLERAAVLIAVTTLVFYAVAGIFHYRYSYLLFIGKWTSERYLRSLERTADVAEWANGNLPAGARILSANENRIFYFDRPVVREVFLNWRYPDSGRPGNSVGLLKLLKQQGMTHYLVADAVAAEDVVPIMSDIRKTLGNVDSSEEIYRGESRNIRDSRYVYCIYRIR